MIHATTDGIKFPDATIQATAAKRNDYILVVDQKAAGTDGGTPGSANTWLTRTLNTIKADPGSNVVSLSSNQVTLRAGTYQCSASAPAYGADRHKIRLRDITSGSTIAVGTPMWAEYLGNNQTVSSARAYFTLAVQSALEIQHSVETVYAGGWGDAYGGSEVETYAVLECHRLD